MKFIKPQESADPDRGRRIPAYDNAQARAIERQRSCYIHLKCDHYTTWEADELFSESRPARNKMWCETCCKWKVKMPKPALPDYSSEPLF